MTADLIGVLCRPASGVVSGRCFVSQHEVDGFYWTDLALTSLTRREDQGSI